MRLNLDDITKTVVHTETTPQQQIEISYKAIHRQMEAVVNELRWLTVNVARLAANVSALSIELKHLEKRIDDEEDRQRDMSEQ